MNDEKHFANSPFFQLSFHPEVSIALRMKQSAFPVFQLQGEGCQDIRMNTVPMAAAFAKAFDMVKKTSRILQYILDEKILVSKK